MTVTTVVSYLDALVAALEGNAALVALANVYDGQPVTSDPTNYLAVGYQLDDEDTQATGQNQWRTLGRTIEGTYTIPCLIRAHVGDTDHTSARTAAAAILDAAWAVVLPTGSRVQVTALGLSGVISARFSVVDVKSVKGDGGSTVFMSFDCLVREYIVSA